MIKKVVLIAILSVVSLPSVATELVKLKGAKVIHVSDPEDGYKCAILQENATTYNVCFSLIKEARYLKANQKVNFVQESSNQTRDENAECLDIESVTINVYL